MKKYCRKCGSELDRNKYCPRCKVKQKRNAIPIMMLLLVFVGFLCLASLNYYGIVNTPIISRMLNSSRNYPNNNMDKKTPDTDDNGLYYYSGPNAICSQDEHGEYVSNELIIVAASNQNKTKIQEIINDYSGSIVGEIEAISTYQIQFKQSFTFKELEKMIAELESKEEIEAARINYVVSSEPDYYPNDSMWKNQWDDIADEENWGMEAISAPEAWEYKDRLHVVNIGLYDNMFDVSHEDLSYEEMPLGEVANDSLVDSGKIEWHSHGTHTSGTIAAIFDNQVGVSGVVPNCQLYAVSDTGISQTYKDDLFTYGVGLTYLIHSKKCKVVNISMGQDRVAFCASRGDPVAIEYLKNSSSTMAEFLLKLSDLGNEFVICKSAGNLNGKGEVHFFEKDDDDSDTAYQYYAYSDFINYINGEEGYTDRTEFEKYRNRVDEIKSRLDSGNVDAGYDVFSAIKEPEIKNRIIVVGAIQNNGTHKEGGFLGIGAHKVSDGYSLASFSQCGNRVDVVAPGVDIESTVKNENKKSYDLDSGTSMAAPHVSGVAGLVFSANPELTGAKVKEIICDTATGKYGTEGYGLVNAGEAVRRALNEETSLQSKESEGAEDKSIRTPSTKISTSILRDIVLVLDTSGSMDGIPLNETKKAANQFVDTATGENAEVGIVTYNDSSTAVSDFQNNANYLKTRISSISADGMTNIESGLSNAYSMLLNNNTQRRIIVLMSDGIPNEGKEGAELIEYANSIKEDDVLIYTLGFFENLSDEEKIEAQNLLEQIATEGCHYEVANADDLVFFFNDIADQISGQKYIYIRIACPVDVSVSYNDQTLNSSVEKQSLRTDFGTLSFEKTTLTEEEQSNNNDDRVKILRLKEGVDYNLKIVGTGHGVMNYKIGFMDENGEYSDFRTFRNVRINNRTSIDTTAAVSDESYLYVDEDGDGKYDITYSAKANSYGTEVHESNLKYILLGAELLFVFIILLIIMVRNRKRIRK